VEGDSDDTWGRGGGEEIRRKILILPGKLFAERRGVVRGGGGIDYDLGRWRTRRDEPQEKGAARGNALLGKHWCVESLVSFNSGYS
jgi:hypothetical protein